MSKGLILIGAGGHSRSCIDTIEREGSFKIAGLVGVNDDLGKNLFGHKVLATDSGMRPLAERYIYALLGMGQIDSPAHRIRLYELALEAGFLFPIIISPTAYVSPHAVIGAGTIVMHGAIINAGAIVGKNCIINSNALVEHDSQVSDHCHISTGAILNGNTSIGAGSFIGSGAVLKEGISIGAGSLVGMGVMVRKNLENGTIFSGEVK
jgi:sugar O-acyltransferase (sialic acid O-acetyltransferase NeuD family)